MARPSSRRRLSSANTRCTSAAVSAEVASSRIRIFGSRAERLGDLHHLAARQRQAAHRRQRMDVFGAGARQRRLGDAALRALVDQAEAARRVGDADVVGHAQVRHQRQLLEDAGDAGVDGILRMREAPLVALQHDAALVGLHDAGHDLDQRRLAGAVLAEQRMDAAAGAGKARALERAHAAIALGDVDQFKNGLHDRPGRTKKRPRRSDAAAAGTSTEIQTHADQLFFSSLLMISWSFRFTPQAGNELVVKKLSVRLG